MKKPIQTLLRFGAITLTLGAFAIARAETQTEKGDAGQLKSNAEVFDCEKDVWMGSHMTGDDCDLVCFWWEGGFFNIKCVPTGGMNCGIAIFGGDGTLWASENSGGGGATETWSGFMPEGTYYVYTGYFDWYCFQNPTTYLGPIGGGYCSNGSAEGTTSPTGTFYGCRVTGAPGGGSWETYYQEGMGWENPGVPFQQDARAGEKKSKTKGGGELKVMSTRKKAKFFCECRNNSDMRGATGVKFRGVSKKKFKQKYIEIGEGNKTAEVIRNDFCKNYDPGFAQRFKCIMKPKGRFKKMKNVRGKCVLDCGHDGGVTRDTKKVKFTANMR